MGPLTSRARIGLAVGAVLAMAVALVTSERKPQRPLDPRGVRLYGVSASDDRPAATAMTSAPVVAETAVRPATAPARPTSTPAPVATTRDAAAYRVVPVKNGGTVRVRCRLKAAVTLPEVPVDKPQGCGHDRRSMPSERLVFHPKTLGVGNCLVRLPAIREGKDWREDMRAAEPAFLLDQKGCLYVPHVAVIRPGTSVTVKNSDRTEHNIHTYRNSMAETTFNMSSAPDTLAESQDSLLERPGHYIVKCDIHPWMSGHLLTTSNPYFDVTFALGDPAVGSAPGEALIEHVPPGVHAGEMWHEGVVESVSRDGAKVTSITYSPPFVETFTVTVEPGKTAVVDLTFEPR